MTITERLDAIKERLVTDPIVEAFEITRERITLVDAHLRVRLVLVDGSQLEFSEYMQHSPEEIETEAAIQYKLGTQVPENWIPFIPVHNPGSNREIRLQRAAMPRLIPDAPQKVEPRGAVLRSGLDEERPHYFIHEEEVPRAGALVTRTYQRVRGWDGKIYTWLGRRKQTGRGQGSSGLEFDKIVPLEREAD